MDASRYDKALGQYQRTWMWATVVPSAMAFFIWTYLWLAKASWAPDLLGFVGVCPQVNEHVWYTVPTDTCVHTKTFVAVVWSQPFLLLSPILAWALVRRRMRRMRAPASASPEGYREAPPRPISWPVSGPFPRWARAMFFVSMFLRLCPVVPWPYGGLLSLPLSAICAVTSGWDQAHPGCDAIMYKVWLGLEGLAQACLLFLMWMLCRRDAARFGVIEEEARDGVSPLLLRTPRQVLRVTIAECDRSRRTLRLFGSPETWYAVDSIDDLAPVDDTDRTA